MPTAVDYMEKSLARRHYCNSFPTSLSNNKAETEKKESNLLPPACTDFIRSNGFTDEYRTIKDAGLDLKLKVPGKMDPWTFGFQNC